MRWLRQARVGVLEKIRENSILDPTWWGHVGVRARLWTTPIALSCLPRLVEHDSAVVCDVSRFFLCALTPPNIEFKAFLPLLQNTLFGDFAKSKKVKYRFWSSICLVSFDRTDGIREKNVFARSQKSRQHKVMPL